MRAPAKINLYLHVTGKRADGYHLLDTLIVFIDIYDEIDIVPSNSFSLEICGEFAHLVENDEKNIVTRAYRLMQEECASNSNVAIKLVKNIPVGAGLGGGSTDAAATLIILNDLWKAGFSKEKLSAIGLKLGADVPIFINRHAAFVSGIGEKIADVQNFPELYAILVYPNKPIATKDVFNSLSFPYSQEPVEQNTKSSGNTDEMLMPFFKNSRNDLENSAISFVPEIQSIVADLSALEGCILARMSGSGSTSFGVFTEKNKAEKALSHFSGKNIAFWSKLVKITKQY